MLDRYRPLPASTFIETGARWALAVWQQGILRRAEYEFQALGFWMTDCERLAEEIESLRKDVLKAIVRPGNGVVIERSVSAKRGLVMSRERVQTAAKYLATFAFLAFPELREGE